MSKKNSSQRKRKRVSSDDIPCEQGRRIAPSVSQNEYLFYTQGQSNASGDRTMLGSCDSSSSLNFPIQIPSDRSLSNLEDDREYQSEIYIPGYVYGDQSERGSGGNLHNLNGEQCINLLIY